MAVKKKALSSHSEPAAVTSAPAAARPQPAPGSAEMLQKESEKHLRIFDQAIKLFRANQFREARALFETASAGPQKEVSHNARLHVIMCDRRLQKPVLDLKGLDDHYNYAIERINVRDLECARKHLDTAVGLSSTDRISADHLFYALALCSGLAGDWRGAYENLKRAIELNPKNRLAARNDSDFANVAQQPLLQQLLYPEKSGG